MRSISPVVAIVVLMLMTVAAAGMAYLTITSYQSQSQAGTQGGIESIGTTTRTQLKIESVAAGKIYLRNLGSEIFENPNFYVEGRPLEVSGPDQCQPGKVCVYEGARTCQLGLKLQLLKKNLNLNHIVVMVCVELEKIQEIAGMIVELKL
jgi:flagellin-like protein